MNVSESKLRKLHQRQRNRPPQARLPSEPRKKRKRSPPSSVLHPQAYLDFWR